MTCRDVIAVLADYLEAALPADAGERMADHLRDCEPCRAYLATYRRTRDVVADAQRVEMPVELRTRLRNFLLSELGDDAC